MLKEWSRNEKIGLLIGLSLLLIGVGGSIGSQLFPRVEFHPVTKYAYYDASNATLILSGGSTECPITFKDVYKALDTFGITSTENMTIILKGVIADE